MIVGKVEIKLRFKMTKLLYAEFSITGGMISNDTLVGFKVYSYGLPKKYWEKDYGLWTLSSDLASKLSQKLKNGVP